MKNHESEKVWKTGDVLQVVSIVATIILSLASLIVSFQANNNSQKVQESLEASRVETGEASSNFNETNFSEDWTAWEDTITTKTTYIGVQKAIRFRKSFQSTPKVTTAIIVFDIRTLADVLHELNYAPTDGKEEERLREMHIVIQTTQETPDGFVLQIGVGMPSEAAKFFENYLQTNEPAADAVLEMHRYRQITAQSQQDLTFDQKWMANYYLKLGTIDVSWLAQVTETFDK